MHGAGTFFDARFNDKDQYPVAAKSGSGNTRGMPDKLTAKLAALHFYQLSIPAPKAPAGSYDRPAFERGKAIFNGPGKCATSSPDGTRWQGVAPSDSLVKLSMERSVCCV